MKRPPERTADLFDWIIIYKAYMLEYSPISVYYHFRRIKSILFSRVNAHKAVKGDYMTVYGK